MKIEAPSRSTVLPCKELLMDMEQAAEDDSGSRKSLKTAFPAQLVAARPLRYIHNLRLI